MAKDLTLQLNDIMEQRTPENENSENINPYFQLGKTCNYANRFAIDELVDRCASHKYRSRCITRRNNGCCVWICLCMLE